MRVLGLTGGIGSGKSMVAQMFARLGAVVIDADQLAREVVEPGQPALQEIAATFGPGVLLPDGRLDRPKLAEIIFADPAERAKLDAITHPRIRARMDAEVKARRSGPGVLIVDIPLLYENDRSNSILCIHKNEGDLARRVSAIDPGVVGASLNDNVARLQMNLRIVQEHVDLSGQNQCIVDGFRPVHRRVARFLGGFALRS